MAKDFLQSLFFTSLFLELYLTEKHYCQVLIILQQVPLLFVLFYSVVLLNLCTICYFILKIFVVSYFDFQVYQEGLRVRCVLPGDKRNDLIPTVLDALLDFHLDLLRKLQERKKESIIVSGVSDIICSEVIVFGLWCCKAFGNLLGESIFKKLWHFSEK